MGWVAAALAFGVFAGCGREEIKVYDLAKEKAAARSSLPEGWSQLPADEIRIGNYTVSGKNGADAQVTVISLPGNGGGELENVNRWRGQVGLQGITEADLTKEVKDVEVAGSPARFFEMSGIAPQGKKQTRLLAAIQSRGGSMWFFKMVGDDGLVRDQKEVFLGFCAKYRYPDQVSGGAADTAAAPTEAPGLEQETPKRSWTAPKGWQEQAPGPMQDGKFLVAGGKATVTISIFQGATGGTLANVNRWRTQQLGLPATDEGTLPSLLTPLDLPDTKASLVDMTGPTQRMVAAIVPHGEQVWFFKMLGDEAAVGAEKTAFIEFVKTAK
jgi:hypothetical protein